MFLNAFQIFWYDKKLTTFGGGWGGRESTRRSLGQDRRLYWDRYNKNTSVNYIQPGKMSTNSLITQVFIAEISQLQTL